MLIPNQLVDITINSSNFQFYKNLGYDVRKGDVIHVPPSELKNGSRARISLICDGCKKLIDRPYRNYLRSNRDGKDYCQVCSAIVRKETMLTKYGVEYPLQSDTIKQKTRQTNLIKYGVENVGQSEDVIAKRKVTCIEKYGYENPGMAPEIQEKIKQHFLDTYGCENPFMLEDVKEKIKQTNLEKYGVEYCAQNEDCKQKVRNTNMERYGVPYTMQCPDVKQKAMATMLERYGVAHGSQSPEIREKIRKTLAENGTTPTSSQQIRLYEIVRQKYPEAELNYPYSTCSLDVFIEINGIKIDCEYDCWYWHQDTQHDIKRDKFLQSQGFKTLRVRSGHLLPSEQELFDAIDYLVNTEHHFKEIILSDWKEKEEEECQKQLPVTL